MNYVVVFNVYITGLIEFFLVGSFIIKEEIFIIFDLKRKL